MSLLIKNLLVVAGLVALSAPAFADENALERAQFMLRQLTSQKVQLENENAKLKAEMEEIKKQSEKQLKVEKAGNQKLDVVNKKKDDHIDSLREKLKTTITMLRGSENERLQANEMAQALDKDMQRCVHNNHELVKLNDQMLVLYENKGVWDSFAQADPFTGLKQADIENIIQEYRFANEDLNVNQKAEYQQAGEAGSRAPEEDAAGS